LFFDEAFKKKKGTHLPQGVGVPKLLSILLDRKHVIMNLNYNFQQKKFVNKPKNEKPNVK
jgi:hypothetical protein